MKAQIAQLEHGRRRTAGTTALYAELSDSISRRRFQELVVEERQNQLLIDCFFGDLMYLTLRG